jgi:type II secretory pathway pseudopilin PulG
MHVHRPKRLHGAGEVSRVIAIIVLGIVIAIGLEQTVKLFHHNHQREQLEAALRRDGQANRGYIKDDIANAQAILQWAVGEADALERAPPTGPLTLHRMPSAGIGSPDAGVWPSAKASGVSNLLPPSAQNWLEYQAEVSNETFVSQSGAVERLSSAYAGLDQALFGHATADASGDIDVSRLTAAQRLMVVERLRAIAEAARVVMRRLLIYDSAIEFIFSTPLDQLDTPQAADRYSRILRATLASHPAAGFVFGGR